MKEAKHIIWSNYGLDYEDWREDLEAEYPSLSENERLFLMYEINSEYLNDERMNLNVQLSQPILMVGDLELWDGQRTGYKEIKSGNIRDCLYGDTDYSTWYVDRLGDVPFPVSWTVKMKKKQKETQDILSYHTQAAGCSDKARAKASGGRQPIEECGRTGL